MEKSCIKESVEEMAWVCGVLLAMIIFEEFEF